MNRPSLLGPGDVLRLTLQRTAERIADLAEPAHHRRLTPAGHPLLPGRRLDAAPQRPEIMKWRYVGQFGDGIENGPFFTFGRLCRRRNRLLDIADAAAQIAGLDAEIFVRVDRLP
jgi:hypothetical protein